MTWSHCVVTVSLSRVSTTLTTQCHTYASGTDGCALMTVALRVDVYTWIYICIYPYDTSVSSSESQSRRVFREGGRDSVPPL